MKVQTSYNYRFVLPLMCGILFFCLLLSLSYNAFSQFEISKQKKEQTLSNEKDLTAEECETEEDVKSFSVIELKKLRFIQNKKNRFSTIFLGLITSPSYEIHLPPPKSLFC
jgi:hypothetical protein